MVYSVPDPTQETAALDGTEIPLGPIKAFRSVLTAMGAYGDPTPAECAVRLITLDQLLAGVMLSTPRPRVSKTAILSGRVEPGFAHTNAGLRRMLVLKALSDLGDAAAAYQPSAKLAAMTEIVKTIGRNQPCDGYAIP